MIYWNSSFIINNNVNIFMFLPTEYNYRQLIDTEIVKSHDKLWVQLPIILIID